MAIKSNKICDQFIKAGKYALGGLICLFYIAGGVWADTVDNTLLMFVGEDLSVVTVASRYPESPSAAPAIVTVVDKKRMETYGYHTLGELLSFEAGFHMVQRASSGSVPYLRGIPDGILFFYDGVPMPAGASGTTRSINPLGLEMALDNIKQVEIIRGAGSVLWGADAFAGIVNIVPMTGRDAPGIQIKSTIGSNDLKTGYFSAGRSGQKWNSFLSAKVAENIYHTKHYTIYHYGDEDDTLSTEDAKVSNSRYFEISANAQLDDWLTLSGRFSDFTSKYTVEDINGYRWKGERSTPVSNLSIKGTKIFGDSHLTVSSYYQNTSYEFKNINVISKEKDDIFSAELLWDKRFLDKGLITAGYTFQNRRITGAQTDLGFLPDYIDEFKSIDFYHLQLISQDNYISNLNSFFTQYRHRFNHVDAWAGVRYDESSKSDANISTSLGINWEFADAWRVKTVFGTGYRAPYSQQVSKDQFSQTDSIKIQTNSIKTVNAQLQWTPFSGCRLAATAFYSELSNYIKSDAYAGTSEPLDQKIYGFELEANAKLTDHLNIFMNLTKTFYRGDDYHFKAYQWSYIDPDDGSIFEYYNEWDQPYDGGADFLLNAGAAYHFSPRISWAINAGGRSAVPYYYKNKENEISGYYAGYSIVNTTLTVKDLWFKQTQFQAGIKNMFDADYEIPGYFGTVRGEPLTFFVEWAYYFKN